MFAPCLLWAFSTVQKRPWAGPPHQLRVPLVWGRPEIRRWYFWNPHHFFPPWITAHRDRLKSLAAVVAGSISFSPFTMGVSSRQTQHRAALLLGLAGPAWWTSPFPSPDFQGVTSNINYSPKLFWQWPMFLNPFWGRSTTQIYSFRYTGYTIVYVLYKTVTAENG